MLFFTPSSLRLCISYGSRVCDNLYLVNSLQNRNQFAYGKYKVNIKEDLFFIIVLI